MKISSLTRALLFLLVVLIVASCSAGSQDTASPADSDADAIVLEMVGLNGSQTFTLADIRELPSVEGWGGTKSSAGVITVPQKIVGVELLTMTEKVGGLTRSIRITGSKSWPVRR